MYIHTHAYKPQDFMPAMSRVKMKGKRVVITTFPTHTHIYIHTQTHIYMHINHRTSCQPCHVSRWRANVLFLQRFATAVTVTYTHTYIHTYIHIHNPQDFMPAMSRVKMKGKRVVLATVRNSCNRDLLDRSKHVYDFDPVFLDDALERIITPRYVCM